MEYPEVNNGDNTFIKDLDYGTEYIFSKAADDTKLGRAVHAPSSYTTIQKNLDRFEK